nr:MAG TPA: hypothetical protein [Caudoviricetes sp.]
MHLSLWSVSKNPQSRHENYRKERFKPYHIYFCA